MELRIVNHSFQVTYQSTLERLQGDPKLSVKKHQVRVPKAARWSVAIGETTLCRKEAVATDVERFLLFLEGSVNKIKAAHEVRVPKAARWSVAIGETTLCRKEAVATDIGRFLIFLEGSVNKIKTAPLGVTIFEKVNVQLNRVKLIL